MHSYIRYSFTPTAALMLACAVLLASPAPAQAALTTAQVEAVLSLLAAFNADSATIANVRASLGGTTAPASGSLWFGAGIQPSATIVERGAEDVPFTTLTLANNTGATATIYTITVQRAGTGSDSSLRAIELKNTAGAILASATSLDSKHQATLTPSTLTIAPGQSITLTLAGDLSSKARSGKTLGLTVVAINASSPLAGTLPLTGTLQKVD